MPSILLDSGQPRALDPAFLQQYRPHSRGAGSRLCSLKKKKTNISTRVSNDVLVRQQDLDHLEDLWACLPGWESVILVTLTLQKDSPVLTVGWTTPRAGCPTRDEGLRRGRAEL